MQKAFADLVPGDYITDMHDGLAPVARRFVIVAVVKWDVERPAFPFPNKHLRVLGADARVEIGTFTERPHVVCGFTYDNRVAGIVVLAERKRQEAL